MRAVLSAAGFVASLLLVTLCSAPACGASEADVMLRCDLGAVEGKSAEYEGAKALKATEGYSVYVSEWFGKTLGKTPLVAEVEAASPDGAQLGIRAEPRDASRKKLDSFSVAWNRPLRSEFQSVKAGLNLEAAEADSLRILLYRSNQKGTLFLKSLTVKRQALVPTEKLAAELELKLKAQGYETERRDGLLVGKRTDERCYYRTFPGEQMEAESFGQKSYAGTTWVRRAVQAEFFPIGPYIYGSPAVQQERAQALGMSLPQFFEHLARDVKAHGGTAIYYANLTMDPEAFKTAVAAAAKHGIQVFGQLTMDLYLRPERGRSHYEQVTVPTATRITPQYRGVAAVAGWMPKEEAAPDEVELLAEYRALVRALDPTHALYTLHNTLDTFKRDDQNLPEWFGFDRYRFRCLRGPYGLLISTPKDMATRLRQDIADFYAEAQRRGRPLIYVLQGYGHQNLFTTQDIKTWSGGAKERLDPWSGFREVEPGVWKGWDRYPPPEHGMFLQCWLAVLEGAKGLLIYFYGPPKAKPGQNEISLVNDKGEETRLWREFGECMKEMKSLLPLFLSWHKEALPRAKADAADVAVNSFIRRFDAQRFLVVLNQRIATWDSDSPALPRGKTELHFDDEGLAGLRPAPPLTFRLQVDAGDPVWDILTGQPLRADEHGKYRLTLGPGRAMVLMQGTEAALRGVRDELGLRP